MQKPKLYVIGSGGYGREIMGYLDSIDPSMRDFEIAGFIDDNPDALKGLNTKFQILGTVDGFDFKKEDLVILAIAKISVKSGWYNKLKNRVTFYSFISQDAMIGPNVEIGEGAIICPGVKLGDNLKMGKMVSVNVNSVLGHDAQIGDFCSIMPTVDIGGGAILGDNIFAATKSTVAPRLEICDDAYLGVGSIHIKNVTESGTYFGNPARRMR